MKKSSYKWQSGRKLESMLCVEELIRKIGDDPDRPGLKDTPRRVVESWLELFAGYHMKVEKVITVFPAGKYDELVIVKDVAFHSTCEHHMLPFYGTAAIGYIPNTHIIGLSKLPRIVDVYARRLQVQERITTQITAAIQEQITPKGVACVLKAKHLCMGCRGVKQPEAETITSSMLGVFREDAKARSEFLQLAG